MSRTDIYFQCNDAGPTWSDVGGIVSNFTYNLQMYARGWLILIKTWLRWWIGLPAKRCGILMHFLSHLECMSLSFKMIQILLNSLAIQKVYFASLHLISRYLTYKSWTTITSDVHFCWKQPYYVVPPPLCDLSLTWERCHFNIIGIYVHLVLLPAQYIR